MRPVGKKMHLMLGVDLGLKENTGVAWFSSSFSIASKTCSYEDAKEIALSYGIVYIDAPLSIPLSRKSIEDREGSHHRDCDHMLRHRSIKFFPITLGPMRSLTTAGMEFKDALKNSFVHETFPGAFYDVFGVPRKSLESQVELYEKMGFKTSPKNQHESDAIACLLTAYLDSLCLAEHLHGRDGCIAIPMPAYCLALHKS